MEGAADPRQLKSLHPRHVLAPQLAAVVDPATQPAVALDHLHGPESVVRKRVAHENMPLLLLRRIALNNFFAASQNWACFT
jgi:hypothetical protein